MLGYVRTFSPNMTEAQQWRRALLSGSESLFYVLSITAQNGYKAFRDIPQHPLSPFQN